MVKYKNAHKRNGSNTETSENATVKYERRHVSFKTEQSNRGSDSRAHVPNRTKRSVQYRDVPK
eukprot:539462-Rhodomonas_salina.1